MISKQQFAFDELRGLRTVEADKKPRHGDKEDSEQQELDEPELKE